MNSRRRPEPGLFICFKGEKSGWKKVAEKESATLTAFLKFRKIATMKNLLKGKIETEAEGN